MITPNNSNSYIITTFKKDNQNLWNEWWNKKTAVMPTHTATALTPLTDGNPIIQARKLFVKKFSIANLQYYFFLLYAIITILNNGE